METTEKLADLTKPFQALWNSARVICIGVGNSYERKSVVTRIILREEKLIDGVPFRPVLWFDQIPKVLVAVVDLPKSNAVTMLINAIDRDEVYLENGPNVDRVLLKWPLPEPAGGNGPARLAALSWSDVIRYEVPQSNVLFGVNRTCMGLVGTGDFIRTVMPPDLRRDIDAKLLFCAPDLGGLERFCAEHLPGIDPSLNQQRTCQILFPVPLDMEQREVEKLDLRAPIHAPLGQTHVIVTYRPSGRPDEFTAKPETGRATPDGNAIEWQWGISWPLGAESGKAFLYYEGEQVSTIELRRWPAAGTLRAAIDCYFDPEHERLRKNLFGDDRDRSFEKAVVRLMNLHGVPLIRYGGGDCLPRRSDAAGLVGEKENRVVVLVECTVEKPELKFSGLKERSQALAGVLKEEAKVLPVVFTQTEPPDSAFKSAFDHGVALIGRHELETLLDRLSVTTAPEDALDFLTRMKTLSAGRYTVLE